LENKDFFISKRKIFTRKKIAFSISPRKIFICVFSGKANHHNKTLLFFIGFLKRRANDKKDPFQIMMNEVTENQNFGIFSQT